MNERGFTLVELLVAVAVSLVVFGLVGTSLVAYQRDAVRTTGKNDSQDQARLAVDRIVRELRNVASSRSSPTLIETAGPYDLVFQTITPTAPPSGSQNAGGISRVRYCVPPDSAPGDAEAAVLIAQTQTWTSATAPPNPWPITGGASTACPSTPSVPAGSSVSTFQLGEGIVNRYGGADRPAFLYDSATLAEVTTVSVDLRVDSNPDAAPGATSLRSAAFLRNQNQAPVVSFTATPTGGGHLLLNGGGSSDPDNQQLTYEWFQVVGGTATPIGKTGMLDWVPAGGPGTYSVRLTVTDTGGLTSSETRTVEVS